MTFIKIESQKTYIFFHGTFTFTFTSHHILSKSKFNKLGCRVIVVAVAAEATVVGGDGVLEAGLLKNLVKLKS